MINKPGLKDPAIIQNGFSNVLKVPHLIACFQFRTHDKVFSPKFRFRSADVIESKNVRNELALSTGCGLDIFGDSGSLWHL